MNKILTIGSDSFLLPENTTDADLLKIITLLSGAKRVDPSGNYVPNAETRYGESVVVIKPKRAQDIEVRMTATRVLTEAEYDAERDAGQAAFLAAHPEGKEGLVHA